MAVEPVTGPPSLRPAPTVPRARRARSAALSLPVPRQASRAAALRNAPVHRRVVVDGVAFDALREAEVVEHVCTAMDQGLGGTIVTPNVDILRQVRRPEVRELVEGAELVVPDGMPIVWASRLQGDELPERVAGSSLIWTLSRAASQAGRSIYLLGGAEGVAGRAAARMAQALPGLRIAGWDCPAFGFEKDPQQLEATLARVAAAQPDLVFVALGFPKQEHLMQALRERVPTAWSVGCGGALTMVSGEVSRAPEWLQRSGFEWVHRLAMEPRRMAKRYVVHGLPYAVRLLVGAVAQRGRTPRPRVDLAG